MSLEPIRSPRAVLTPAYPAASIYRVTCDTANVFRMRMNYLCALGASSDGYYGVIVAGHFRGLGDLADERAWRYLTEGGSWQGEFGDPGETEHPRLFQSLGGASVMAATLNSLPHSGVFGLYWWVKPEEGYRVPLADMLRHGVELVHAKV